MSNALQHVWSRSEAVAAVRARWTREVCCERCTILSSGAAVESFKGLCPCSENPNSRDCAEMQRGAKTCFNCGIQHPHHTHIGTHVQPLRDPSNFFITRVICDVRAPWCVFLEAEKSPFRLKPRAPGGMLVPCVINTRYAKPMRKGGKGENKLPW